MEDSQIISLLWDRAEAAIEALRAKFGKRVYATAVNILDDRRDAEEAESDTYLAVWNAVPPAHPEPLCAFVYRIGRNAALYILRRRSAQKRSSYEVCLDELAQTLEGSSMEEQLDARQLGRAIDRFLDTLSKENRVLFLRRYWFGDDIPTLAQDTGMRQGTVSVRLHRIRAQLKDYLIKEGFSL